MDAFSRLQQFNKKFPDRKAAFQALQKIYLAKDPKEQNVFASTEDTLNCDPRIRISHQMRIIEGDHIMDLPLDERQVIAFERNLAYGTRLFGTWRNNLSVYRLDDDIAEQAMKSPIPDDTPSIIFKMIPEWAVYVEIPKCHLGSETTFYVPNMITEDMILIPKKAIGFWAVHDRNMKYKDDLCLDLFFNFEDEDTMWLSPVRVPIIEGKTLRQSMLECYGKDLETKGDLPSLIKTALSLLLWLCVEEPDVSNLKDIPMNRSELGAPKFARNKKTGAFVPPSQPTYYTLAKRLGGEVREFKKRIQDDKNNSLPSRRKRPHIRKGHWHNVWIGTGNHKSLKTYWQPAVFVNA